MLIFMMGLFGLSIHAHGSTELKPHFRYMTNQEMSVALCEELERLTGEDLALFQTELENPDFDPILPCRTRLKTKLDAYFDSAPLEMTLVHSILGHSQKTTKLIHDVSRKMRKYQGT